MARPGYVIARKALYKAIELRDAAKVKLADLDSQIPSELGNILRGDALRALGQHQSNVDQAQIAFDSFKPAKENRPERVYYDTILQVCLSVTKDMRDAMRQRCAQDSIPKTELIRRALQAYLNPPAD